MSTLKTRYTMTAAMAGFCATVVAGPLALGAQEEPESRPVMTEQEEIWVRATSNDVASEASVASKFSLGLLETPLSVGVVTSGVLKELGASVLGDAATNIAGVTVQPSSGVHDILVFRGLNSLDSGLVLIDGAPEPEATFYHLYNVDRVEVIKGPSGFLYGGNPLGGVVNLVRERPGSGVHQSHRLSLGSFETLDYQLDVDRPIGDQGAGFRLNGLYRRSDGYRDDQKSEARALDPVLSLALGEDHSLRFDLEWVENEYSPDSGLPIFNGAVVDVPRRRSYQSPFDVSDQTAVRGRIDWQHQLDERWGFTDKLYLNSLDWESAGTIFNGVFPFPPTFSPALLRTLIALDNDQRFVGNQFEATYSGDAFRLLLGLEAGKQDDDFLIDVGLLPAIDPFQPFETATEPIFFLPQFGQAGETTAEVLAPYAVAQIEVGEWASLLLGARFDAIEFEDRISGQSSSDDELSPMLGLVVGPSGTWSIYANYAESFAPPSARVVGERQPKESDQLELGVKWVLAKGRFSGSAALYQLDLENLAIVDETGFSAQQGSQRSEGFELELVGTPRRGWRYQLGYGYLSAELVAFRELVQIGPLPTDVVVLDRAGNEPAFAPSNTLDAWVVRELQSGLGVGLGARWVDEQFLGEDNAFVIDDAWTLDSFVAFELPAWRFSLNLKNLLDEEAFGRGFGRESVIPTKGFEAIFGVEYRR